jgi:hypothetical protein
MNPITPRGMTQSSQTTENLQGSISQNFSVKLRSSFALCFFSYCVRVTEVNSILDAVHRHPGAGNGLGRDLRGVHHRPGPDRPGGPEHQRVRDPLRRPGDRVH